VLVGSVEEANIIKLHRNRPKVSYLSYPAFECTAHPPLASSLFVDLKALRVDLLDYSQTENRPILHRKEEFVLPDHPLRARFARLTKQEEQHGLFENASEIGFQRGWDGILAAKSLAVVGHVLRRQK
jgi:DNA phosphorothioation-associated putative methyltransferase